MMIKVAVGLLVAMCITQRSASVIINDKVEVRSQDKLALNLFTYVDMKGIDAAGDESMVRNLTSEVHRFVRVIFANVEYNVVSSPFAEPIDIFAQTSAERYLREFDYLASDGIKFRQQTLILFTGYRWPGIYAPTTIFGTMCEKAGIAVIPLLNSTGLRSARDMAYDVVRVIGANLGLDNDAYDHCVCSGDLCVMEDKRQADGMLRDWSTCSKLQLAKLRAEPPRACDPNPPPLESIETTTPKVIKRGFQMPPFKVIGIGIGMILLFIICACCISAYANRSRTPEEENAN